jgi:hypothetical protein
MSYCILTIKKPFARMANDEVFSDENLQITAIIRLVIVLREAFKNAVIGRLVAHLERVEQDQPPHPASRVSTWALEVEAQPLTAVGAVHTKMMAGRKQPEPP